MGYEEKIDTYTHTSAGIQADRSVSYCKPGVLALLGGWGVGLRGGLLAPFLLGSYFFSGALVRRQNRWEAGGPAGKNV